MGYCYTRDGKLCCDGCGDHGGVRKRTCPHKVDGLPYCPPPALCAACYKKHGGKHLHDRCEEPAAERQRQSDEFKAHRAAGRMERRAAWGNWHEAVPKGMVGVCFAGTAGEDYRLVPEDMYDSDHHWLDQYGEHAQPWPNHPGTSTKQVAVA